ncbi:FAD-dependent oxidoreductase [Alteribacillus sp. YIM 98480]|uniref:FAD-dependent oxidoreductase n=1 Tax=Alteribacillus sp. YIM 98480 TaxID=2606599 RepID=UPI00131AD04D|nr:FAD-dependent oxidoreductase [Alteribacillus sp. YIM 98480]
MGLNQQMNKLEFDMIVIGAGMAGLSAAGRAAEAGAKVLVAEKQTEIGGSAQYAGFLWTVLDDRVRRGWDDGDPDLGQVVKDNFAEGVNWMRERDMLLSKPTKVLHGNGYQFNVTGHMQDCVKLVRKASGHVALGVEVKKLLKNLDGKVEGALILDDGEMMEVKADSVILATGGFQANPDLRAERIHSNARSIPLRSNTGSTGDGIRLGLETGGAWASENTGFYGHLVSSPTDLDHPSLFTRLSQYHSDYSLLFNENGERFTDESQGDFRNSNELTFQPNARGVLVWDDHVQQEHVLKAFVLGADTEDRLEVALQHGAYGDKVSDLEKLKNVISKWNMDGEKVVQSINEYNHAIQKCPEKLDPPRIYDQRPLNQPPYYALVVEPAISFTHGGLLVDNKSRALNEKGEPIPGLLVAGADVGNVFNRGYAGGLALSLGFALRAVRTAGWTSNKGGDVELYQ